jgi:glycolate oxidase
VPLALVRPGSTAEVQAAVRAAARHGVPIVPRGAGSGLSGGANAIDGCLMLSLERMTDVRVDADAMTATAQAGAVNARLNEAAAAEGLWYPPDPASWEWSTIGGNVATNAGGLCCVKYGVTRDFLLGLEVVLADGRAVRLGHATRKGVAGYDLTSLVCGSEGTLAVVCEATVRLLPRQRARVDVGGQLPDPRRGGGGDRADRPRAPAVAARAHGPHHGAGGRGLQADGPRPRRRGAPLRPLGRRDARGRAGRRPHGDDLRGGRAHRSS